MLIAVGILLFLAVLALMVGVSNDAVNFLNSSFGSQVATRRTIMLIASLGILVGVTFSSGMMEVARKGIFHPQYFYLSELMFIFLAVMLTNVILLDSFNTFGLPTSTTVSIVFGLLGAAVGVSILKVAGEGEGLSQLADYINTSRALIIISGILISVVVAFFAGAVVQFICRIFFTFDYEKGMRRYGAIWGGICLSVIVFFILIKGAKGASFISAETALWIRSHTWTILFSSFVIVTLVLQALMMSFKIDVLKPIILIGTFALAMAFAANDLVNFIGVPLAGLKGVQLAQAAPEPLNLLMESMREPVRSNTILLLLAGIIMVITLWLSKKARRVTETELSLARQDEGLERFESSALARKFVRMVLSVIGIVRVFVPTPIRNMVRDRIDPARYHSIESREGQRPSFDLLRASVNLVMASAVVSFATSLKLPLSTTYVTFMVSMGTSFSDMAWGRDSAVYRISGVMTVIGGWFLTAFMAFSVSFVFALALSHFGGPALLGIVLLGILVISRNHYLHGKRQKDEAEAEIFNLKKIDDVEYSTTVCLEHSGRFLKTLADSLDTGLQGLFVQNLPGIRMARKDTTKIQLWANIIIANLFKTMRLLQKEDIYRGRHYAKIIKVLQRVAEAHRDILMRCYVHLDNNHKGLLAVQIEELQRIRACLINTLTACAKMLDGTTEIDGSWLNQQTREIEDLFTELDENQIARIHDDSSKTRLSILFYGVLADSRKICVQSIRLVEILDKEIRAHTAS